MYDVRDFGETLDVMVTVVWHVCQPLSHQNIKVHLLNSESWVFLIRAKTKWETILCLP